MLAGLRRYARWLHTAWPAGGVEPFPVLRDDGGTSVPGLRVAGDLAGVPLLKFALDTGARAVRAIAADPALRRGRAEAGIPDLVIVGAGPAGMNAAAEARRLGLSFRLLDAADAFSTVADFPARKPIFTYPRAMEPAGVLRVSATAKEPLLDELRDQAASLGLAPERARVRGVRRAGSGFEVALEDGTTIAARRVLLAVGRSGDFRRLGVPGEERPKVFHRLHDPADFAGARVLVVGGGDSALEAAVALAEAGAEVTLSYRRAGFARPRPGNVARAEARAAGPDGPGGLRLRLGTRVAAIGERDVTLERADGARETLANDAVFEMLGRAAPVELLKRCGVPLAGALTARRATALAGFVLFCAWLHDWKSGGVFTALWARLHWFPMNLPDLLRAAGGAVAAQAADADTLLGTLAISAAGPAFWYTLAYTVVVVVFGVRRIRRRRTPYVTAQTLTLMAIQALPLFVLPEIGLPLLGRHDLVPRGVLDALFPAVDYGHGREYWRAYGLVLAWPLNVYNVFTPQPLGWWLAISFVQTAVLIPLAVLRFGKGAYCGWVCSCGALAETLGDTHRHRMPHGPGWNRLNLAGQVLLALAVVMLLVRIAGWVLPGADPADRLFEPALKNPWKWTVDVFLAGVVGYGVYFWFSGRVWCRFFCPLAAFMHVVARVGRFRILAEKAKCISCNQCTAACHQGIDVMAFANKGLPMADPQCVRCSACVQVCPTGVLAFGEVDRSGVVVRLDRLAASPVRMREPD